jgi:hypothetical protein
MIKDVTIKPNQLLPKSFFSVIPNLKPKPYDPTEAKKLLPNTNFPNRFELTIHVPNDRYINDAKICEAIRQILSRV